MKTDDKINVFWFRRDLRLNDNTGLYHALKSSFSVLPIFIFDTEILEGLPKDDARITFIHHSLRNIRKQLQEKVDSSLAIFHGKPSTVFRNLISEYNVQTVFLNHDYEPYAQKRDETIKALLSQKGIEFKTFKDQVIFEKNEIVKENGGPYAVYTPFMKKWKAVFDGSKHLKNHEITPLLGNFIKNGRLPGLSLNELGFKNSYRKISDYTISSNFIENYEHTRNHPAKEKGTSLLGPHLRFGTVSIRRMVEKAMAQENETFLNELIWREFFMQILWHYPETIDTAFKPKYDRIQWLNNKEEFKRWKEGKTGFALVDAGMRQLNETGFMHNRVRMVTASFLCKHLLIDWRWGEAYFAEKLLDYELASNVGNWQWVAGSGVDAAPYFRIFNPITQAEKFDKDKKYIKKWVPEFGTDAYPEKMVDHRDARERCLMVYREALT